jgi:hypothetical protein
VSDETLPLPVWVVVRQGAEGTWLDLGCVSHTEEGARIRTKLLDKEKGPAYREANKPVRLRRLWLVEEEPK